MEKIVIAELDIDIKKLLEQNKQLAASMKALTKERAALLKQVQAAGKANESEAKQYRQVVGRIKETNAEYKSNKAVIAEVATGRGNLSKALDGEIQSLGQAKANIKELQKAQEEVNQSTEGGREALIAINERLKENVDFVKATKKARAEEAKSVNDVEAALQAEIKTENEAAKNTRELRKARRDLDLTTEEGLETQAKINAKIEENDALIKSSGTSLEQQRLNIGNYREDIEQAAGNLTVFGVRLGDIKDQAIRAGVALKAKGAATKASSAATGGASKALRIFRLALIGTGIGAFVVALGAMIAALATTQQGINAMNKVLIPLKNTAAAVLGIIQDLGAAFIKAFVDPVGAMRDVLDILGGASERVAGAVEDGSRIAQLTRELSRDEADFIRQVAKLRAEAKELNKDVEDTEIGIEERIKASRRAVEVEEELLAAKTARTNKELELLQIEAKANDTSDEARAEIAEKEAELLLAREEAAERYTTARNKLNILLTQSSNETLKAEQEQAKQLADTRRKFLEQEIKDNEVRLRLYAAERAAQGDETFEIRRQALIEQFALEEETVRKRARVAKKSEEELNADLLELGQRQLQEQTKLTIEELDTQLRLRQLELAQRVRDEELTAEQLQVLNEEALEAEKENREKALEEELAASTLTEEQKNIRRLELAEDFQARLTELTTQAETERAEEVLRIEQEAETRRRLMREAEIIEAQEERRSDFELQLLQLEQQTNFQIQEQQRADLEGVISSENAALAINNIKRAAAVQADRIRVAAQTAELQGYAQVVGGIAQLAGAESVLGKAAAIAQATIDTYAGANRALAEGGVAGIALAIATIATGLANVGQIIGINSESVSAGFSAIASGAGAIGNSQIKRAKFEEGGLIKIGGSRHAAGGTRFAGSDGTRFEAEEGELLGVMNRRAAAAFMAFNDLFSKGAGVASPHRMQFEQGGIVQVQRAVGDSAGNTVTVERLEEALGNMPAPVVTVTDIAEATDRVTTVTGGGI